MNFTYLQAASFFPTVRRSSPWRSSKPTNRHAIVRAVSTSSHGCCEMSGTVWAQANTQKTTQGNSNSSRVAVNCCFRFVSWIIKKRQVMSQESITPKKISVYRKSSRYIFINIYYIYIYILYATYMCVIDMLLTTLLRNQKRRLLTPHMQLHPEESNLMVASFSGLESTQGSL